MWSVSTYAGSGARKRGAQNAHRPKPRPNNTTTTANSEQRAASKHKHNHNHSTSSAAPASTTASTAPTTLWPLTFVPALVVVLPVVDVPLAAVPVLDFVPVAEEPAPVLVEPDAEVDETTVAVGILEMVDHVPPGGRH